MKSFKQYINESEFDPSLLIDLLATGDETNIELAYTLAYGQNFDLNSFIQTRYGKLFSIFDEIYTSSLIKSKIRKLFSLTYSVITRCYFSLPDSARDLNNLEGIRLVRRRCISYGLPKNLEILPNLNNLSMNDMNLNDMFFGRDNINSFFSGLKKLKRLNIGGNNIINISQSIFDMTSLEHITMGYNNIEKLPDNIGNLINLKELWISGNKLTKISPKIGNLQSLEVLNINNNKLEELPDEIKNLTNLKMLKIYSNPICNDKQLISDLNNALPNTTIIT
jgi:Leucine-rich repeat (LRR) protein